MKDLSFEAQMLHIPYEQPDVYGALSMPVYQSVSFEFDTAEAMEAAFCGRSSAHTYSRISNPTVQYFEQRVQRAIGAFGVTALSSGMAAIFSTLANCAYAGSNVIVSSHLFGNTYVLLRHTLEGFGVEPRFCNMSDPAEVASRIDGQSCAVFLEVISNPQMEVADLSALSDVCRKAGLPLIADTTAIPFTAFRASDFGVDVEIISSTKYISGGATSVGGLIVDYGSFDWSENPVLRRWAGGNGREAFGARLRREVHRNLGAYMSPQTAALQTLGLETLKLRFERQASTALELARRLRRLEGVRAVNYSGLEEHPHFEISSRQFGDHPGAMLTFDLASREACFELINKLKMIRRATNLFDNRSLIIHPASTIYGLLTEELRQSMDVKQECIRLSVGLESADDLYGDLEQASLR
ncbi:MAG: PLP-dependent transferase [Tannerellaceae bacterium]|jgi:O-acetylhomoserine (thiol)-lyase|nr:PLP-dependent transferase [Tannerellaceae bacterium]